MCYLGLLRCQICHVLRASPTLYAKPPVNVRATRSKHFVPFNAVHQMSVDRPTRSNFCKPEAKLGEVSGCPNLHHIDIRHPRPTKNHLSFPAPTATPLFTPHSCWSRADMIGHWCMPAERRVIHTSSAVKMPTLARHSLSVLRSCRFKLSVTGWAAGQIPIAFKQADSPSVLPAFTLARRMRSRRSTCSAYSRHCSACPGARYLNCGLPDWHKSAPCLSPISLRPTSAGTPSLPFLLLPRPSVQWTRPNVCCGRSSCRGIDIRLQSL